MAKSKGIFYCIVLLYFMRDILEDYLSLYIRKGTKYVKYHIVLLWAESLSGSVKE